MVERYLGKEQTEDIFCAAMLTGLMSEKQAAEMSSMMEKDGFDPLNALKTILGGTAKGGKEIMSGIGNVPKILGMTALLGGGAGVLGANIYDVIKEQVSHEDPEEKFNSYVEAVYKNKKRELEDAKWMDRIRALRDELRRGHKKMPTEEYANKYKELVSALDERSV